MQNLEALAQKMAELPLDAPESPTPPSDGPDKFLAPSELFIFKCLSVCLSVCLLVCLLGDTFEFLCYISIYYIYNNVL